MFVIKILQEGNTIFKKHYFDACFDYANHIMVAIVEYKGSIYVVERSNNETITFKTLSY